ncbi:GNAT family N-acetyltransferase [Clostridium akagii]|uniref:GNAT family N-acetyltransferase n=1 Tax=Clostridium akagii TaxID=91623 RepID=UPI000562EFCE|nr:GNAT family N-acetyltransferase [Clostridium akagii]
MVQIKIRKMKIEDYETVVELWNNTKGVQLDEADSKENISRYLNRNPGLSLVAERGNEIVGAVLCGHDGRRGFIHHLAVHEGHRMNGIGKKIMAECLNMLKKEHIELCYLFVFIDNDHGIKFWNTLGCEKTEDLNIMSIKTH